ncbi:MAG: 30S ribosomal protein S6 [Desulfobulbaceae bacterium]|nr:30S ribosomal protein S6 [Desulfobulbaceae bacterium]HIJ78713.1 30S ribosomal protein S6 [Deltaproteobacteria bacterium]
MRRYETIIIVKPGAGEAEAASVAEKSIGIIEKFDGSIVKNDPWGLKKLAYPINKEIQGYYLYIEYAGLPDGVKELERQLRIDDRVIKYMTVKTQDVFSEIAVVEAEPEAEEAEDETEE